MILTSEAILYYADNPVDFVEDIIRAKPDANQRDILNSVAKYQRTSVRSGHGIGKTATEAWLALWFLTTRPYPKIPCTAPTQHQLWPRRVLDLRCPLDLRQEHQRDVAERHFLLQAVVT